MINMRRSICMIMMLFVCLTACSAKAPAASGASAATEADRAGSEDTGSNGQEDAGSDTPVVFETTDLEGNTVRSEDVFGEHKLTMINLWGTYCGPCIREMPDLEILNQRLSEKDCAIIGVVVDAFGTGQSEIIKMAEDIIADTGVTYANLLPWDALPFTFPAQFIPTTYFIDTNGNVVGEAAVGARGAGDYEALIDTVLESMEQE